MGSCKEKGKRVEWTIGRFLSLFCTTVYDLILCMLTQAMTLKDVYFFLYIPLSLGAEQHSAGWHGVLRSCSAVSCTHTATAAMWLVAGVSGEGKPRATPSPATPAVGEHLMGDCDGHRSALCQGLWCAQLYCSSKHWQHSLSPTLRVGDLSLSKTVTYK